nr:retrovirus-related Pol polyprotein from transposon TNT 1-94 [Tanacetum cinerariifolium]
RRKQSAKKMYMVFGFGMLESHDSGIQRQLMAGYPPHQNGVAERKNQTILNMDKDLMAEICELGEQER